MGTMRPKIVGDQAACVRRTPLRKYPVPDFGDARQHLQGSATGSVRDFDMPGALISLSELKSYAGAALGRPIVASLQDHYRARFSTAPLWLSGARGRLREFGALETSNKI